MADNQARACRRTVRHFIITRLYTVIFSHSEKLADRVGYIMFLEVVCQLQWLDGMGFLE